MQLENKPVPWSEVWAMGAIALALLISIMVHFSSGDAVVEPEFVRRAAATVERRAHGATVVVHPPWRDDIVRLVRTARPELDVRLAPPVRSGLPWGHLVYILVAGAPGPAVLWGEVPEWRERVGNLELRAYHFGAGTRRTSLLAGDVGELRAAVVFPDRTVPCDDFDPLTRRKACRGMREWNYVGPVDLRVGGVVRRCLWAHPVTGATLAIERGWPRGVSTIAVGYGLADGAAGAPGGAEVELAVFADTTEVGRFVQRNAPGWTVRRVTAPAGASRLRLEITTPNDGARHFCVDLWPAKGIR